jgi:hypothetical protein
MLPNDRALYEQTKMLCKREAFRVVLTKRISNRKIRIRDDWFEEKVFIPMNNLYTDNNEMAIEYLLRHGFNVIGASYDEGIVFIEWNDGPNLSIKGNGKIAERKRKP